MIFVYLVKIINILIAVIIYLLLLINHRIVFSFFFFLHDLVLMKKVYTIILKLGPARQVDPGPSRPRARTGPG
jgi:hypothetical protein